MDAPITSPTDRRTVPPAAAVQQQEPEAASVAAEERRSSGAAASTSGAETRNTVVDARYKVRSVDTALLAPALASHDRNLGHAAQPKAEK